MNPHPFLFPSHSSRSGIAARLQFCVLLPVLLVFAQSRLFADQIEMQNGDRYFGKVLSLTNDILVLQSEVLGTVNVSRSKVTKISLGTNFATNGVHSAVTTSVSRPRAGLSATNSDDLLSSIRKLENDPAAAQQVKQQFLTDADPAAKAKFDQMLASLMSGTMTIEGLRAEAKSAAEQLKNLKKELGSQADPALDGYLAVLESFLSEPLPARSGTATNKPSSTPDTRLEPQVN